PCGLSPYHPFYRFSPSVSNGLLISAIPASLESPLPPSPHIWFMPCSLSYVFGSLSTRRCGSALAPTCQTLLFSPFTTLARSVWVTFRAISFCYLERTPIRQSVRPVTCVCLIGVCAAWYGDSF